MDNDYLTKTTNHSVDLLDIQKRNKELEQEKFDLSQNVLMLEKKLNSFRKPTISSPTSDGQTLREIKTQANKLKLCLIAKEEEIEKKDSLLEKKKKLIILSKNAIQKLRRNLSHSIDKINESRDMLEDITKENKHLKSLNFELENSNKKFSVEFTKIKNELNLLKERESEHNDLRIMFDEKMLDVENRNRIFKENERLKKSNDILQEQVYISEKDKDEFRKSIKAQNIQIEELKKEIESGRVSSNTKSNELNELKMIINEQKTKILSLENVKNENNKLEGSILTLEDEKKKLENEKIDVNKSLSKEILQLQEKNKNLQNISEKIESKLKKKLDENKNKTVEVQEKYFNLLNQMNNVLKEKEQSDNNLDTVFSFLKKNSKIINETLKKTINMIENGFNSNNSDGFKIIYDRLNDLNNIVMKMNEKEGNDNKSNSKVYLMVNEVKTFSIIMEIIKIINGVVLEIDKERKRQKGTQDEMENNLKELFRKKSKKMEKKMIKLVNNIQNVKLNHEINRLNEIEDKIVMLKTSEEEKNLIINRSEMLNEELEGKESDLKTISDKYSRLLIKYYKVKREKSELANIVSGINSDDINEDEDDIEEEEEMEDEEEKEILRKEMKK